jgi:hypothetical protein
MGSAARHAEQAAQVKVEKAVPVAEKPKREPEAAPAPKSVEDRQPKSRGRR